jgi:hypothetical protein
MEKQTMSTSSETSPMLGGLNTNNSIDLRLGKLLEVLAACFVSGIIMIIFYAALPLTVVLLAIGLGFEAGQNLAMWFAVLLDLGAVIAGGFLLNFAREKSDDLVVFLAWSVAAILLFLFAGAGIASTIHSSPVLSHWASRALSVFTR